MTGLAIGICGVALVTGVHPQGGWWVVVGTLAVVASSLAYAIGSVYGQLHVHGTPGPVLATGNLLFGAALLMPLAAADPPSELPGLAAVAGLTGLILLPTVLGQLMLFRMLRLHGSRRSSLITYLMPGFALVYGSTILDEQVTAGALAGLALILGGVALASGQRILGPAAQETPA
jgi:drug/metabolite transporter (DMT)-like permease